MISPGRLTLSFSKLFYNKIKRDLTSKVAVATEQFEETSKGKLIIYFKINK